MAELGFVGDGPNSYQLWLGGNVAQTALAQEYKDRVKVRDLEAVLEPLLAFWKNGRRAGEGFGYFTSRVGMEVRSPHRPPVLLLHPFYLSLFSLYSSLWSVSHGEGALQVTG